MIQQNCNFALELIFEMQNAGCQDLGSVLTRFSELEEEDSIGVAGKGADGVSLMTIHKSKGLEFPLWFWLDSVRPGSGVIPTG